MSKKIFLIAGEPSGDALGEGLMRALKASGQPVEFVGIGGELMKEQGLDSLLPMEELCVMGLWEVLAHLPRLLKLINGVVEEIEKARPDAVVTIDLPDFNFQVAKRLKKRGNPAKIIHYVAPSVWAWRPKRAEKISNFLDALICLFPFEPPYFEKHNLPTKFVGHPIVEQKLDQASGGSFREKHEIGANDLVLGLFLGSREAEIKKMGRILKETTDILLEQYPELQIVVPTLPNLEYEVRDILRDWQSEPVVVTNQEFKYNAFVACDLALAVSGTVGLELAYIGVPHAIAYKTHPVSYLIARVLIKIKYIHLANILLDKPVVPEYIQGKCNSIDISKGLLKILKAPEGQGEQKQDLAALPPLLVAEDGKQPSESAAEFVLDVMSAPTPAPPPQEASAKKSKDKQPA